VLSIFSKVAKTKRFPGVVPSLFLAGALMAASGPGHAQEPRKGGTLMIGTTQAPRHLNPAVQSGIATGSPGSQLFASLLRADSKWGMQPYLAEKWETSKDGLSVTLRLVKNAVFHDGKPITSADVAFSLMAVKENHPFQTMLAPVKQVDTPDPYTAIVRLANPHPALLLAISTPALVPILPKHVYGDGKDLKTHPANSTGVVGSGPFKLVEFKPGQHIVLERFDKFFLTGRPYLDRIVYSINPDASNLNISLERGEIQMLPFMDNTRDIQRLSKNPNLAVTAEGHQGIGPLAWLAFNLKRKPLSDQKVRQAISYAIDRKFISKALQAGLSAPATGPIVPSSPFYTADVQKYDVDLKKADALLDAAGYKRDAGGDRFTLTVDYMPGSNESQKNTAEYLKSQLKKVGIKVEVRASPDFPSWSKRIASHDFDMTMDVVFNWGDPVIGVHRTYVSSNIRDVIWTNTQSYSNPKVDELLAKAGNEMDPAKRKAYYAEFQKIVADELPVAWINVIPYHTAYSKKLHKPPFTIWGALAPFDELYLDSPAK
jgi:peptide/nickel transport system substrate-binding protein